jgi:cyclopropane-fatty-acyl-phospholipid synthase
MAVDRSERIMRGLLEEADIAVDGERPWDIQVHNPRFYERILRDVVLGLGESYMDGWWDCAAIDQMIDRAIRARLDEKIKGDWKILAAVLAIRVFK